MTRFALIDRIARAIAEKEGFYVTAEQARDRRITWPTIAQRHANPGNIRRWKSADGREYPRTNGYVDFVAWAKQRYPDASREEVERRAIEEGWRVLTVLVGRYIDGAYTQGKPPTFAEMFRKYAPASDNNDPDAYARFVAARLGAMPQQRPIDLIG